MHSDAAISAAYAAIRLAGQSFLNVLRLPGQRAAQDFGAVLRHEDRIFDANAERLARKVQARLDGYHHPGLKRAGSGTIVHVQSDVMRHAMPEIFAHALAV